MAIFQTIPAGDLRLDGGTFVYIDGIEFVRQKLASRLKFFLGEWFIDTRQGVPYFRDVFVKNPNIPVIRLLFRKVILTTPGIVSLTRLVVHYDAPTRNLSMDFEALSQDGPIVVKPTDRDFIVSV